MCRAQLHLLCHQGTSQFIRKKSGALSWWRADVYANAKNLFKMLTNNSHTLTNLTHLKKKIDIDTQNSEAWSSGDSKGWLSLWRNLRDNVVIITFRIRIVPSLGRGDWFYHHPLLSRVLLFWDNCQLLERLSAQNIDAESSWRAWIFEFSTGFGLMSVFQKWIFEL